MPKSHQFAGDSDSKSAITGQYIARELGLSQSTVSRALRGDPRVAPATIKRVREAADRLHYTPNSAARNLITRKATTIGVVVSDIKNPFYPELIDILHNEFALAGFRTILLNERTDAQLDRYVTELVSGHAVDGLVYTSAMLDAPLVGTAHTEIPIVLLNRIIDTDAVDRVVSDNTLGGHLAAQTVVAEGHRQIAWIAGPHNTSTNRDREAGFIERLKSLRVPFDPSLRREGTFTHDSGFTLSAELLTLDEPPTAIVAANDVIALGVLDAARCLGLVVPDDLSVVGFDNIEMSGWQGFNLTTVEQPLAEMAKQAARMLLERVAAQEPPVARTVVFPVRLVHRATVGPPSATSGNTSTGRGRRAKMSH